MIVLNRTTGHPTVPRLDHIPHLVQMPSANTIKQNPLHAGILSQKMMHHIGQLNLTIPVKH